MIIKVSSGVVMAGMLMFFTVSASSQVDPALIQKARAAGVTQEQIDAALAGQKEGTGARHQVGEITSSGTERQQPEIVVPDLMFPEDSVIAPEKMVFGREIFSSRNLTFAPDYNMATPPGYVLGPGDEVVIDVWGASEMNVRTKLSPEGSITLSGVGPVYLNGLTITDAGDRIRGNLNCLRSFVDKEKIPNVNFTGYRPLNEMPSYFAASDVLVISLTDEPLFKLTVPLKFYSYLTASRPIYSIVNGEVARMVKKYSLGISADPSDVESISRGFEKLYLSSQAELKNYSANAAEMISNRFSKEKNIARITSILWPSEIDVRQADLQRAI